MKKYAIFTGSLATGFSISKIVEAQDGEKILLENSDELAGAQLVEIKLPSSCDSREEDYDFGMDYIVFGSGLSQGFSMYGPFPDFETAQEFVGNSKESWEHHQFDSPAPIPVESASASGM